ncbi:hypothetical protein [Beijerinckia indica]|uniref:Uncharacterized protein n=1 Tax=Beijerinckia indica subsp. indica (strain ATCC 9039 / DSM 1715 / NCIMB 8712) TaxID=395963 RepID=B2IE01_BEII9|nr:hypothetical protein [Beijerinckia indica]ACB96932.1 hypothetical protein Bind_3375 [Beijerinckia indica subsp. indica ATCC 9039]
MANLTEIQTAPGSQASAIANVQTLVRKRASSAGMGADLQLVCDAINANSANLTVVVTAHDSAAPTLAWAAPATDLPPGSA